ncbi:MAG TPA: ABC transporter ATP-binding protein [Candidatus Kapabacteria bacterium]|nr:ABC transporter ATP-binding protein [Candidatus Kapabacteria bacterium]
MAEILRATKVNKFFSEGEDFHVLKDVSISIAQGEFVSIIGKSGSGKSTLLYLLSTLDTSYSGEIAINGKVLGGMNQNELAALRNECIGFVFQFHFLLPEFTALENVMLPALKLGKYSKTEIEDRAMNILAKMDMQDFAQKLSSKLSGGQQQRVAIARALINEPLIIMADEPTGNLDTHNTEIVFEIFRNVVSELGNTIIAVTHDPDFAARSDRTIELVDGRVV